MASIEALRELAELDDDLSEADREILIESAETAMTENPKTKVSALKVKKVLAKTGKATAPAARDLLVVHPRRISEEDDLAVRGC